jgi:hypothetical protein
MGLSATACQATAGAPTTRNLCQRGPWQDRILLEPVWAVVSLQPAANSRYLKTG